MKKTLVVSVAAAALLSVACASDKAAEKPAETPAAEPAAAPAETPAAAPAAEGEAKPAEGSCGGAPKN